MVPRNPTNLPYRHSSESWNPEGVGGAIDHTNRRTNQRLHFSYLGVPAPAGMSDWYESTSRTPIRDVPSNQPRCRLPTGETCQIVDRWSMAE